MREVNEPLVEPQRAYRTGDRGISIEQMEKAYRTNTGTLKGVAPQRTYCTLDTADVEFLRSMVMEDLIVTPRFKRNIGIQSWAPPLVAENSALQSDLNKGEQRATRKKEARLEAVTAQNKYKPSKAEIKAYKPSEAEIKAFSNMVEEPIVAQKADYTGNIGIRAWVQQSAADKQNSQLLDTNVYMKMKKKQEGQFADQQPKQPAVKRHNRHKEQEMHQKNNRSKGKAI